MLQNLLHDAKLFLILMLISVVTLTADSFKFLNIPKSIVQNLTIPIQYGLYKSSQGVFRQFEFITLSRRASQENKALEEQLANVLSENAELRKKLSEVVAMAEQEKSISSQTFNLVAASPVGINRFLNINKGSEDGLKINQAVIYKNNFIGLIKEVTPKKSQVILLSDPDLILSAFVQSENGRAKGVLTGQFGQELLLDKILHQESIRDKDLVYSEGTEIAIPRGLILGEVTQVMERENEVFKQAKVKPVFDVTNLDLVFVITD